MPKKSMEKNSKGTKKNTTKKAVKNVNKNETVKSVVKETAKPVVKETTVKTVKKERRGLKSQAKALYNRLIVNTPFVISFCVIVVLIAALVFTLCVRRIPKVKGGNEVIASIKGKSITAQDLYVKLRETYGSDALKDLIDTYIADKEVKITDKDTKYVDEVVDYYKNYADYYKTDLATFLVNYVGLTGITTEDEFYDYVLADYKKTLAVQKFIGNNASEEDLKEYYKKNYSDSITAKHILIEVDSEAEDQDKADKDAYNKAVKLIQKLNKANKNKIDSTFEDLAKSNSDDTETYSNGGLIKDFAKKDVEEAFWNAAYKLKDGKYTGTPIKTSYGYHIILRVSSKPVKAYKKIKDDVKVEYAKNLLSTDSTLQVKKWDELRKQYKLSIKDDLMNKLYKDAVKKGSTPQKTEDTSAQGSESTATQETEK